MIDVNRTTVIQTGARTFAINFVLANGIGFLCNGNGGNVPLPPGCTKDGISYRAEISSNVASVVPGLNCTIFSGTANRAGQVDFGFRVRFEEKNSPKRKTCILRFTLGSSFSGGQQKLTYTLVPDPNPSADE